MHRKSSAPATTAVPETACHCCRRSTSVNRTHKGPLHREVDLGWERAAYLALYDAIQRT